MTVTYHTEPPRPTTAELAVNLADLDRLREDTRHTLLAGKLATDSLVRPTPDARDVAVRFTCDTTEAALLCDLMRSYDKSGGDRPTRVLIRADADSPWRKVPDNENLTYVDSKAYLTRLNPRLFPIEPDEIDAPLIRPIDWK